MLALRIKSYALGSSKDQVIIKSLDSANMWYGFYFYPNSNIDIKYAQIKGLKHIISDSSMISIYDSNIEGNYVSDSDPYKSHIIYSRSSNIHLSNTVIKGNGCPTGSNDTRNLIYTENASSALYTLYMANSSLINNIIPSSCLYHSAVRAVVFNSGIRVNGIEFSNKIYQITDNDYNDPGEDGIYISSGNYTSDLALKPLGYNCENPLINPNCNIVPYYVFGSINIYNNANLI